jgi:hypothetical protein
LYVTGASRMCVFWLMVALVVDGAANRIVLVGSLERHQL